MGRSYTVKSSGLYTSENAGVSSDEGRESLPPNDQGFPGKVRPPGVSRELRGDRKVNPMHSMLRFMRPNKKSSSDGFRSADLAAGIARLADGFDWVTPRVRVCLRGWKTER